MQGNRKLPFLPNITHTNFHRHVFRSFCPKTKWFKVIVKENERKIKRENKTTSSKQEDNKVNQTSIHTSPPPPAISCFEILILSYVLNPILHNLKAVLFWFLATSLLHIQKSVLLFYTGTLHYTIEKHPPTVLSPVGSFTFTNTNCFPKLQNNFFYVCWIRCLSVKHSIFKVNIFFSSYYICFRLPQNVKSYTKHFCKVTFTYAIHFINHKGKACNTFTVPVASRLWFDSLRIPNILRKWIVDYNFLTQLNDWQDMCWHWKWTKFLSA